ncbi:hypothetical protein JR316_0008449 [Psilocybe cubensis]|uniref:Uncharacterized protein n=2 Tax=Psilocybe cubensis TaxID=181762 RepID=A0A8H7XU23_PSICU|nr:hypothetical protein JR316_0008449 [Psilocybe cubensis]KAH9479854.1 hypothetical protein JR316_0008449 [Psilocybe cubensis]
MKSSSSTSLLASSQHQPARSSSKNWEASFGNLSSSYGFSGGAPSLPHKSQSSMPTNPAQMSPSYPSASHSSQPTSSTAGKDYQNAFGRLSSSYGFGGSYAPSFSKKTPTSTHKEPKTRAEPQGYEAAFGKLVSSYGFGANSHSRK